MSRYRVAGPAGQAGEPVQRRGGTRHQSPGGHEHFGETGQRLADARLVGCGLAQPVFHAVELLGRRRPGVRGQGARFELAPDLPVRGRRASDARPPFDAIRLALQRFLSPLRYSA